MKLSWLRHTTSGSPLNMRCLCRSSIEPPTLTLQVIGRASAKSSMEGLMDVRRVETKFERVTAYQVTVQLLDTFPEGRKGVWHIVEVGRALAHGGGSNRNLALYLARSSSWLLFHDITSLLFFLDICHTGLFPSDRQASFIDTCRSVQLQLPQDSLPPQSNSTERVPAMPITEDRADGGHLTIISHRTTNLKVISSMTQAGIHALVKRR